MRRVFLWVYGLRVQGKGAYGFSVSMSRLTVYGLGCLQAVFGTSHRLGQEPCGRTGQPSVPDGHLVQPSFVHFAFAIVPGYLPSGML